MPTTLAIDHIGNELLVNSFINNQQGNPAITGLSNGRFVAVWTDLSGVIGDSSAHAIAGQVFDAGGTPVGSEFLVPSALTGSQTNATVTALSDDRFVVSWEDESRIYGDASGSAVKAQIFNISGEKIGSEFLVNTARFNDQAAPAITTLANGNFVVIWEDASGLGGDGSTTGIKAQIYNATAQKIGTEFLVNTGTRQFQNAPAITALENDGFAATWIDFSEQADDAASPGVGVQLFHYSVKAQLFGSAGQKLGGELQVSIASTASQSEPRIAGLANGGFVVTWQDGSGTLGDGSTYGIKAQIFDAEGNKAGGQFLVNTATDNAQRTPVVAGLVDGGFVVAWTDASGTLGDASGTSIKAQAFDALGRKSGGEFLVNTATQASQLNPAITARDDGGFVISWEDGSGTGGDNSGSAIKAQIFHVTTTHTGTASADILIGGKRADVLDGAGGHDRLDGGAGTDTMTGGTGDDTYVVDNTGDQAIEHAGEGIDTIETGLNNYTLAAHVENLRITGSAAANVNGNELANEITGNSGRNVIYAGAGGDVIHSGGGDDYLDGGTGADTFHGGSGNTQYVFDNPGDRVIGEGAGGGSDSIFSSVSVNLGEQGLIEILRLNGSGAIDGTGNALANTITGSSGANVIAGGLGVDTLYGKGGADTFRFAETGAANKDSIWDFDADDKISLDLQVFANLLAEDGHLAAGSFVKGGAATVAGRAQIIYTDYTGILSYDADGKGGAAAQEIAYIGKKLSSFDHNDILVG